MQQESQKKLNVYTASQQKQHILCYELETTQSLKILRSIQKGTSVANVCEINLSNFNKAIDKKEVNIYEQEKQGKSKSIFQQIMQVLRNQIGGVQEQEESDSADDWEPDYEDQQDDNSQEQ